MADTLLHKICRLIGLQSSTNASFAEYPATTTAALETRMLLQQRLMSDQNRQARQQAAMLGDDAMDALLQLLHSGLTPAQIVLLDQSVASLQAMQAQLREDAIGGFSLHSLLDQVCLLVASQANRHDSELHPLVYGDLPPHFRGDPEPLRTLLVLLCSNTLRSMESGALIIRAMLDETETNAPDIGGQSNNTSQVCFSLQRECGAITVPWGDFPSDCRELATSLDAQLSASEDEYTLCTPLTTDTHYRKPMLPNPIDAHVIAVFHPCDAARASLSYRLRGMNLHSQSVKNLSDINLQRSVALLLALPPGPPHDHLLAVALSLALPALVVLSNTAQPINMPATVQWLPASIDDQRLYHRMQRALRQAESNAITPPASAPTATAGAPDNNLQQVFLGDFPDTLSALRACLQRNDRRTLKNLTHKLKGGAAYSDLPMLYQVACRLDQAACCAPVSVIDYLLLRLEMEAGSATIGNHPTAS